MMINIHNSRMIHDDLSALIGQQRYGSVFFPNYR